MRGFGHFYRTQLSPRNLRPVHWFVIVSILLILWGLTRPAVVGHRARAAEVVSHE